MNPSWVSAVTAGENTGPACRASGCTCIARTMSTSGNLMPASARELLSESMSTCAPS